MTASQTLKQFLLEKNMAKVVADYVYKCPHCRINKPRQTNKEPQKPFDLVSIDTIEASQIVTVRIILST